MSKEYIIGRCPETAVQIPEGRNGVSSKHVKITVHDDGEWEVEDLNSANGTFVKDRNGNFQRVYRKKITEKTVLRLGQQGPDSFVFMAHRVVAEPNNYAYEFKHLQKLLARQRDEEEALERKNSRNMNIVKLGAPAAMVLCMGLDMVVPALKDNPSLNLMVSRGAMCLAPFVVGMFFGIDRKGAKMVKQRRLKVLTCPCCNHPVSDYDIENLQCSRCRAK